MNWCWVVVVLNSVIMCLVIWRVVMLHQRLDLVGRTVTHLVFCHRAHVRETDAHQDMPLGCGHPDKTL
jgi:hypothetical protein